MRRSYPMLYSLSKFYDYVCTVEERQITQMWIRGANPRPASLVSITLAGAVANIMRGITPGQSLISYRRSRHMPYLAKIRFSHGFHARKRGPSVAVRVQICQRKKESSRILAIGLMSLRGGSQRFKRWLRCQDR